jgi:hypothetical protein
MDQTSSTHTQDDNANHYKTEVVFTLYIMS